MDPKKKQILLISPRGFCAGVTRAVDVVLETLKQYADTIYVLENGEAKLAGSHEQLLKTSNFYSDYWKELTV